MHITYFRVAANGPESRPSLPAGGRSRCAQYAAPLDCLPSVWFQSPHPVGIAFPAKVHAKSTEPAAWSLGNRHVP
jgi:hypothetical protein